MRVNTYMRENMREHDEMKEELEKFRLAFQELLDHSKERDMKVDEMYQLYKSGGMVITILKWTFTLIMALGGAYLLLKQIFTVLIK